MVEVIKKNKVKDLGIDVDRFIRDYGVYILKVDRFVLDKNDVFWVVFKEFVCELLYGVEGIGVFGVKVVIGGMLFCERLEGILVEFVILRGDIFDF